MPRFFPDLSRLPRRSSFAVACLVALAGAAPLAVRAQDGDEDEPEAAVSAPIVSTQRGEVPTTGGRRPGPLAEAAPPARRAGVPPVALAIEAAGIAAEVERLQIIDGAMQNPTGPWVVSWYKETARLGETGNAVLAGHVEY